MQEVGGSIPPGSTNTEGPRMRPLFVSGRIDPAPSRIPNRLNRVILAGTWYFRSVAVRLPSTPFLLRCCGLVLCLFALGARAGEVQLGGPPDPDELAAMRASGVRLIVDLRTPGEGVAGEAVAAARAGIRYVNLPVGHEPASANVQARLASLLEETGGDVLLHCASGNRAGEVWARHLLAQGASLEEALEAGRDGGLQEEREGHVRAAAGAQESGRTE